MKNTLRKLAIRLLHAACRHLTASQRGMIGAKLANLTNRDNRFTIGRSNDLPISQVEAARRVNVSVPSVKRICRALALLVRGVCRRRPIASRTRADAVTIANLREQLRQAVDMVEGLHCAAEWHRTQAHELTKALSLSDRLAWAGMNDDSYREFYIHSRGFFLERGADGLLSRERCAAVFNTTHPSLTEKGQ